MDAHYDVLSSITHRFQWLSSAYRQVTYVLLTRSPLRIPKYPPFDLHVLGMPPALILSQDQTLHKIYVLFFVYLLLILSSIYYKNCIVYFLYTIVRHIQFSKTKFRSLLATFEIILLIKSVVNTIFQLFLLI